ncbi:MAG: hypothetical protein P4L22_05365 [Candidatus Babeliales bacterium]|nr:hypothetical protein [Candidatus Babeliales bacterium]
MKQYIFALLLLCSASIAQADRIVRVTQPSYTEIYDNDYDDEYNDEDDYDNDENDEYETSSRNVRCYQRPVIKKTVYIQKPRRIVYIQPRPVRHIVYRRPVCVYRRTSCGGSSVAAGLVGLGFGTMLGAALSQ